MKTLDRLQEDKCPAFCRVFLTDAITGVFWTWLLVAFLSSTQIVHADNPSGRKAVQSKNPTSKSDLPVTGPGKSNASFDDAILAHLEKSRCTAATFALMIDGEIVYSKGYGWLDEARQRPTPAKTPMRVASVSKPITAATVKSLMREGKLRLDSKAVSYLPLDQWGITPTDPRWANVTVEQLLEHKGGWDIKKLGFDPMFQSKRVTKELSLAEPPGPNEVIRWMLTKPLQFEPGERSAYSNFGYCILGRIIEKVTKHSYIDAVRQEVCKPAGMKPNEFKLAYSDSEKRDPDEPWYNEENYVDWMDAHGAIVASSPSLCRFLQAFWISGERRKPNEKGYIYTFFGSMPGTSAIVHQRVDGVNFACAFNGRHKDAVLDDLVKTLNQAIDAAKN